ncbi:type II toxin-antitoxin system HicB family antitoxin [Arthrobacter sp. VKM Ac-2550]|uniref:type II toxin-antitoxin system HicB family antitoxin n=1 Tax=Crystallibacter permensis TaxID=1938888 RepID=UPI002226A299|nr:type II toxin-antitoxin system HicB family antitoxin [Arthrobacter sp. VKM Ac-2550]
MDISRHVQDLQGQLVEATELAGEQASEIASQLIRSLDASLRLVILEVLSEAASEITSELAPGSVDVRLRGRDPEFVVTPPLPSDTTEAVVAQEPASSMDYTVDGRTTRTTLRLPENLKTKAEAAAAREGLSVNTWLVRAVATALADQTITAPVPPANSGTRFTGWVR